MAKKSLAAARVGNVAINEDEGPVVIKITIPAEVYATYSELADSQELTVGELMAHRLARCADHSSIRSLYFTESQVRQLEAILQTKPLSDPEKVLGSISNWFRFRLNEFEPIPVSAQQAKRIHLGAYTGCSAQEHLQRVVLGAIAKATGA